MKACNNVKSSSFFCKSIIFEVDSERKKLTKNKIKVCVWVGGCGLVCVVSNVIEVLLSRNLSLQLNRRLSLTTAAMAAAKKTGTL